MPKIYCERPVTKDNNPPMNEAKGHGHAKRVMQRGAHVVVEQPNAFTRKPDEAFLLCVLNGNNSGYESAAWITLARGVKAPKNDRPQTTAHRALEFSFMSWGACKYQA